ncbi:hypothetical protein ACJMK2_005070 [Sinanodonta woodiana]|uniref:Uncharacterized protein n=1 Tax=Sinanodonta woodiana TaxID=1069815 RepID=A0ABD3VSC5_SINWO
MAGIGVNKRTSTSEHRRGMILNGKPVNVADMSHPPKKKSKDEPASKVVLIVSPGQQRVFKNLFAGNLPLISRQKISTDNIAGAVVTKIDNDGSGS